MRIAIYARRSTDEHQAASLGVQIEEATRFCAARGWDVVETFQEDAVSRAEFVKRPALVRMLAAASASPRAFDAVVMRDETRLGGDLYRTGMVLQDLHDHGVELHYYSTGERVSFDDPTAKLMAAVKLYASELERLKIASRTREHLEVRARRGAVVGGRVYGYDNVPVMEGERRVRVEYRVNLDEAAVVREVFERHANGEGIRAIAKVLNARGLPSPHAGARGTGSWSPSCLHSMLRRERYRGVLVWGAIGSTYRGGTRVAVERPEADQIRVERPDLAIVDEDLWRRAQARTVNTSGPRPTVFGAHPRYLLVGISRCAHCGGPIHAINGKQGSTRIKVYVCGWHRTRGDEVCPVTTRRPVEAVDDAVVTWVRDNVLSDVIVRDVLRGLRARIEGGVAAPDHELAGLDAELARVRAEITRLTSALATADTAPDAVVQAIVEREKRAAALRERAEVLREAAPVTSSVPWHQIEADARRRIEELRGAFTANVDAARAALKALLRGPLLFTPTPEKTKPAWQITGEVLPRGFISVCDPNESRTDMHRAERGIPLLIAA